MRLITLENETPVFNPEIRTIKEFSKILMRDKDRNKENALKELSFVHFYCTYDSRFEIYDTEDERIIAIMNAINLPDEWVPDVIIENACERYTDMMKTRTMAMAKVLKESFNKLEEFMDEVSLTETNNSGNLVFDVNKYHKSIQEMTNTIKALKEIDEIIEKEMLEKFSNGNVERKKERSLVSQKKLTITDGMQI
jgi:hypothetical protein